MDGEREGERERPGYREGNMAEREHMVRRYVAELGITEGTGASPFHFLSNCLSAPSRIKYIQNVKFNLSPRPPPAS